MWITAINYINLLIKRFHTAFFVPDVCSKMPGLSLNLQFRNIIQNRIQDEPVKTKLNYFHMKAKKLSKHLLFIPAMVILIAGCNIAGTANENTGEQTGPDGYRLVWSDEFDYSGLPDSTKWKYDTEGNEAGWGNREAQFYTSARAKNARVGEGKLIITAHREQMGNKEFTSARLVSRADWKYAKIEVNAKLPSAVGTWPAIWMMPAGWSFHDGNWPEVGEIDIMEHVGYDTGIIHASAHSKDYQWQAGTQKTGVITVPEATQAFHSYILEWSQESLRAFVDDSLYFQYKNEGLGASKWPYDKPFYLILNVAVGGHWGSVKGIDTTAFPQAMEVDYVRVYRKAE